MFYKVIYKDKVIDVLDKLNYARYQKKYDRMILCEESEAQAIISSDEQHIWHEETLFNIPVAGYDTVRVEEIDEYEYKQLKVLGLKTPEQIIDEFTLLLIDGGVL